MSMLRRLSSWLEVEMVFWDSSRSHTSRIARRPHFVFDNLGQFLFRSLQCLDAVT